MQLYLSTWLGIEHPLNALSRWDWDDPIYMSWYKGRQVPLFKTLLSSTCTNDCKYCAFRRSRHTIRTAWKTEKLVNNVLKLWKMGRIEGFFLSSSVFKDPESVVEKQLEIVKNLRMKGFKGYINLRLMPGTPKYLIEEASSYVDRLGVNIEAATPSVFYEIAPDKGSYKNDILKVLDIASRIRKEKINDGILKAGIATQIIVGVGNDDLEILKTTEFLLKKYKLTRVFYSPFEPIPNTPLENHKPCSIDRVRRLYQAFYLMRDYNFSFEEFKVLINNKRMFLPYKNLKKAYATINREFYPIDLRTADYSELLKVPGIGPRTAKRIIWIRENGRLNIEELAKYTGLKRLKEILKYAVL
ncbi:MAG: radical SAM protein [Thermofilum sp. ex4484_82]|nr:MAG: radical SAM protein [Thermofilum sp. ex4484_82]OYT37359.1 MAG: radical SAM protein [Archaeoglobales archaeon ex4484_92]RLE73686.1 MAG: radical SAM protein [Thermoprotei archaeon]